MTDTDLRLIHSKLNSLSERLDKLEVQFNLISDYINTSTENKCVKDYLLKEGDFLDAGTPQQWRNKDVQ
jgi:hypothetical protein